ncbi:fatty acyl-CoA reductase 1-like [Diachasmimorpha longicaudata]|uniref:fatty acyl-CoA reductase 1-like n=1 Tax=Diachasmimorpha longicaudata TaxID=58733 RepID=UPI0030B8FB00
MIMSLAEWYESREILVTGVTGEVGRILLEKILRTLPNVKLYTIVRSRDGLTKDERLKKIFSSSGFERLRQENPDAITHVRTFEGNLVYSNLGLSPEDCDNLKNVQMMFHTGGSTDCVYEFCKTSLPNLRVLAIATNLRYHENISEVSLEDEEKIQNIPLALLRLPTVGPACYEPMPGFTEILRGPTALMIGAGFALGRTDIPAEVVPVDFAVNALIVAAWERGTRNKDEGAAVYNVPVIGCTWGELVRKGQLARRNFPYPTFGIQGMTSIGWLHWTVVFFLEWLPSVLCDCVLNIFGGKSRCVAEYDKVRKALQAMEKITTKPLTIERSAYRRLEERLTPEDREKYPIFCDIDLEAYIMCAAASAKKNCINESNAQFIGNLKKILLTLFLAFLVYLLMGFRN